jgi:serine/threonine protein kinase
MKRRKQGYINSFDFKPGKILSGKYEIISLLGSGWEGEVYRVCEQNTGIVRAAKFFFPQRNHLNQAVKFYAKKLHKLRHCSILIQYHTQERIIYKRIPITFFVSEYVEGKLLSNLLNQQPGKRFSLYEGLHLLHALAAGVEEIHKAREYHGDLHDDNIIVQRKGLGFIVKLVDLYNWGSSDAQNTRDDVYDLVRIFYDSIGGARFYSKYPPQVKKICCGLRKKIISKKFRTAGHLRQYLENMSWSDV